MRRCSRLRCQRLFILFGCVHHYQMYVPITFVGLPLDFRKKGRDEVGWKKSGQVGWWLLRSRLGEPLTVLTAGVQGVYQKPVCFCFMRSTSDLRSFRLAWENWGKHCFWKTKRWVGERNPKRDVLARWKQWRKWMIHYIGYNGYIVSISLIFSILLYVLLAGF